MKMISEIKNMTSDRKNERGAALISVLLLSMLLLIAGGALVLTTTMSAVNAIDSTAEMQAYYGAEAGLQSTINVLRGNVWSGNATPAISFRSAVEPSESNAANDPATNQSIARLSNWLNYTDTASYPSHVIANGEVGSHVIAYDVTARDLDNSKIVKYSTTATFEAGASGCIVAGMSLTCGSGANTFTLTYIPQAATTLTAYPAVAAGLGSFQLTKITNGNVKIEADKPVTFRLRINQTLPWAGYDILNATISGEVKAATSDLKISFTGTTAKVDGTSFALCATCHPLTINYAGVSGVVTALSSTLTAPQPKRVLVRSIGYGPKGAIKRLEMVLNQSVFDFEAPAVLTMRGADNGTNMTFEIGNSNAKLYSGVDNHGTEIQLPTFAVLGGDVAKADAGIKKESTVADPQIGYLDISTVPATTTVPALQVQTPDFLQTADKAREALNALQTTAESMGRYNKPASGESYTVSSSNTTATGITFVDGNCNLDGGSGLLVVTGNLNMNGNPSFNGVILVLGTGVVNRDGGGNGNIYGAMVVASFNRTSGNFTAPSFNTNGGGNSTMQYDSLAVSRSLGAIGAAPGGIREF
ncbi:MAG: hypothetical protein QOH25_1457 [Acidobacteriota bacterium]|jgi:hypothetical protein|nr:hypothetical protein [Acidobacteriota bacterium]